MTFRDFRLPRTWPLPPEVPLEMHRGLIPRTNNQDRICDPSLRTYCFQRP